MTLVVEPPDQHCYSSKLIGYDQIVTYRPGKTNLIADALSRHDISTKSQFLLLPTPDFEFLKTLSFEGKTLSDLHDIHKKVQQHYFQQPTYTLSNEILYYKAKLFLRKILH